MNITFSKIWSFMITLLLDLSTRIIYAFHDTEVVNNYLISKEHCFALYIHYDDI